MTALRLLTALLCCASLRSLASASELLLPEVDASVERAFPLIIAARANRDAATEELRAAQGGFDPRVRGKLDWSAFGYYENQRLDAYLEVPTPLYGTTFYGGYRLGRGNIADYYGEYETLSRGEVRVGAKVPLLRDGWTDRRRVNIQKARVGIELAELDVVQQRIEVLRTARMRYWDWVASGLRLALAENLLRIATERDEVVRNRIGRGDLPAIEGTDNARAIAQRQAQVAGARRGLEQATIELSLFLRDDAGQPILAPKSRLPASLLEPEDLPPIDDDVAGAMARRPEPRRFRGLRLQNEFELRLARNQLLPALDVSFFLSKDLGSGKASLVPLLGEVAVLLDVPVLMRQQLGRLGVVRAQGRRLDAQLAYARDRVTADLRDASSAIAGARARFEATRMERALAAELEALEIRRFTLGDSTLFIVNQREQAAVEAALREVDALADFHKAAASYRAASVR